PHRRSRLAGRRCRVAALRARPRPLRHDPDADRVGHRRAAARGAAGRGGEGRGPTGRGERCRRCVSSRRDSAQRCSPATSVARLEWAMNVALHAPDAVPLEPEALRTLPPPALARLTLRLDPSVTLLASRWPVDAMWDANQAGVDPAPTVDLDAGGAWLEIRR